MLTAILVAVALNSLTQLFNIGHWSNDLFLHYSWAWEYHQALTQGELYPRWMALGFEGLGENALLYYAPLFFGLVGVVRFLTGTVWDALVLVETAAFALSFWFTYALLRRLVGFRPALLGGAAMAAAPQLFMFFYHFISVGSGFGFPFEIAAIGAAALDRPGGLNRRLAVAVALVVLSHTLTGFMLVLCLPCFALCWFAGPRARPQEIARNIGGLAASMALGLGLAMVYLYPALASLTLVHSEVWELPNGPAWPRYFILPLVTGPLLGTEWKGVQIGLASIVLLPLLGASLDWRRWPERDALWRGVLGVLIVGWVAMFMASELSWPIWSLHTPLLKVQYPSRFLAPASVAGGLASLFCIARAVRLGRPVWLPAGPLVLSIAFTVALYGQIGLIDGVPAGRPDSQMGPHQGLPEYLPATAGPGWRGYLDRGGLASECAAQQAVCSAVGAPRAPAWRIEASRPARIVLPLFAFPTFTVSIDDQPQPMAFDGASGLFVVELQPGLHRITTAQRPLQSERIGLAISLVSLLLLCLRPRRR